MRILYAWMCGFVIAIAFCAQVQKEPNIQYVPVKETQIQVQYVPVYLSEKPSRGDRSVDVVATAYTYESNSENITFSGLPAHVGIIAVDPEVIPLGSIWYIEGYGYAIAADTGHRDYINGNRIDLFMKTKQEATEWGVKKTTMHFIK